VPIAEASTVRNVEIEWPQNSLEELGFISQRRKWTKMHVEKGSAGLRSFTL